MKQQTSTFRSGVVPRVAILCLLMVALWYPEAATTTPTKFSSTIKQANTLPSSKEAYTLPAGNGDSSSFFLSPQGALAATGTLFSFAYNYNEAFNDQANNLWTGLKGFINGGSVAQKLATPSSTLSTLAGSGPSPEIILNHKEEILQKAGVVKTVLERKLHLLFSWKNILTVTKWGVIVASSAQTAKILYELWIYEDMFQNAAEQLKEFKNDQTSIYAKLDEMISILDEMSRLIVAQERFSSPVSNENLQLSTFHGSTILDDHFDKGFLSLSKKFNKLFTSIQEEIKQVHHHIENLKGSIGTNSKFFQERKDKSLKNMIVGAGCFAVSTAASIMFPPIAPVALASHAGGIISGVVAGINYGLYYYSNSKKEKIDYRLREVARLQEEIANIRNQSLIYVNHFEEQKSKLVSYFKKLKIQEKKRREHAKIEQEILNIRNQYVDDLVAQFSEFYYKNNLLFWYRTMSAIFFVMWLYNMYLDGFSFSSKLLVSLLLYCSMMFTLNVAYDLTEKQQMTFDLHLNASSHIVKVTKTIYEERYKHECIWYELPVGKQFELEIKSILLSLIPGYGDVSSQITSRNSSGHLIHNTKCLHYRQVIESDDHAIASHLLQTSSVSSSGVDTKQINNPSEITGGTYLDFVNSVAMKVCQFAVDSVELMNTRTSFTTKIWCTILVTIALLVLVKKIVFCC